MDRDDLCAAAGSVRPGLRAAAGYVLAYGAMFSVADEPVTRCIAGGMALGHLAGEASWRWRIHSGLGDAVGRHYQMVHIVGREGAGDVIHEMVERRPLARFWRAACTVLAGALVIPVAGLGMMAAMHAGAPGGLAAVANEAAESLRMLGPAAVLALCSAATFTLACEPWRRAAERVLNGPRAVEHRGPS